MHNLLPVSCRLLLAVTVAAAAAPAVADAQVKADLGSRLVQNAPYKIEVATSDGQKVLITNAFTLERRRLLQRAGIAALGFSPDGTWLYAVTHTGEVEAIDPDSGKTVTLGKVPVQAGERVVDAIGIGPTDQFGVSVVLAKAVGGAATRGCSSWSAPRRVTLHKPFDGGPPRLEAREGWPDDQRTPRVKAVAPNTRLKVSIVGPVLQAEGQFGAAGGQISKTPLPVGAFQLDWMRDSLGVAVLYPKKAAGDCKSRLGMRLYRSDGGAWSEWNVPESLDLLRGDQPWPTVASGPDGMRWVGVDSRGVQLVEPLPRFRGKVALIAPPSVAWPKLRPGVRALPSVVGGALRLGEMLLETGDLDAAEEELARQSGRASPQDVAKFRQRLQKLAEVRSRRAEELAIPLADLRSMKNAPPPAPAATTPTADDDAVEPAAAATPTR